MYKVIKYFTDLQDNGHPYNAGDTFPRDGLEVSEERIIELATSSNKQNTPLITFIEEVKEQEVVEPEIVEQEDVEDDLEDDQENLEETKVVEEPKKPASKRSSKK